MAANVLKSKRAVRMSILVVRAFIELRRILLADRELARWLRELERKVESHDGEIQSLFEAMRRLLEPPPEPKRRIGFEVARVQVTTDSSTGQGKRKGQSIHATAPSHFPVHCPAGIHPVVGYLSNVIFFEAPKVPACSR
jgi:hypothetical protein